MSKGFLWVIGIFAVVILTGVFGAYFYEFSGHSKGGPSEWAMFGDYVGGLANPLLGFLTIFLLIVSLYYQSLELTATREELAETRRATERSNVIHQNNVALQTRNNLRPQLEEHFTAAMHAFTSELKKPYNVVAGSEKFSVNLHKVYSTLKLPYVINSVDKAIQSYAPKWEGEGFSEMAYDFRCMYQDIIEALVALIHHYDSELIVNVAVNQINSYTEIMRRSHIYDEFSLDKFQESIEEAIAERKELPFPKFHMKANVF